MKRLILCALAAMAVSFTANAADTTSPHGPAYKMDPAKGSFHQKHVKKLKLGCDTCHDATGADVLVVKKAEGGASPGAINREACRGCHQAPGKPTWYAAPK